MKAVINLFQGHFHQLKGDLEGSKKLLHQAVITVFKEKRLPEMALWLWLLSEQVERGRERALVTAYRPYVDSAISRVMENWHKPCPPLFEMDEPRLYMANLGIYYGALSGAKGITGNQEIQKTLTDIRDSVFSSGLSGGMVVRAPEIKVASPDLLLAVMPFGLLSPEDLVMVEAVREMEARLVARNQISPVGAAWLAWYYFEKKDIKKAKDYINLTEELMKASSGDEAELARVILKIVLCYMEATNKHNGAIQIIHTPFGNGSPYEALKTERVPREPQAGEQVKVYVQIWPELPGIKVDAVVKTNHRQYKVCCQPIERDGERLWEATLGNFDFDETVTYQLVVVDDKQVVETGEVYTFQPFKVNGLAAIAGHWVTENTLWLRGRDLLDLSPIYLGISEEEGSLKLQSTVRPPLNKDISQSRGNRGRMGSLGWEEASEYIQVWHEGWRLQIKKSPFQVQLVDARGKTLLSGNKASPVLQWWVNGRGEAIRASWHLNTPPEEHFYGLGERYNSFTHRGEELDCYVYNQYRDQGNRTYMPVPFYISSRGYGLLLKESYYSIFDFAKASQDLLKIQTDLDPAGGDMTLLIFPGTPREVLGQYTQLSGKPALPPPWAFGPWMSSNNWDRDSVVREQVEKGNALQIPSTVLVLEQWSDEATYYIFNDAQYQLKPGQDYFSYEDFTFPSWGRWPDPKGLITYLHENGLRVILWQIPIQKYLNRQVHPQKDVDEAHMLEAGYAVKNHDNTPYRIPEGWFTGSLLMDFSNPQAVEWWFNKRKYLLEIGVDGFKTDGGEFVFGRDLQFYDGKRGMEMRNLYPNAYIEAYYRFVTAYRRGDGLTFSRAGFTGAQNYPAHWAGDERSTFEAFRHSLIAGLTSSLSGIPFWGWDLAGFNGDIPSCELFVRSAQMAAFCPIMQYHAESKGEFNQDRTPWNIADRTGDHRAIEGYRFYANARMNLLPYLYVQARKTSETGIPLMRPLMLEFPEDEATHTIYDQYLLGDDLLVAPVIEAGQTERKVYFPQGEWVNLWGNEVIKGPLWKRVKAELMEIPVYARRGSAILTNCDESLRLGAWVGNDIQCYHVPAIRLYLKDQMEATLQDHLSQRWHIKAFREQKQWHIWLEGARGTKIMIPYSLINSDESIVINQNVKYIEKIPVQNGYYVISLPKEDEI
ncbi:glycoside hydrolase family 31 protein [Alkaliphilus crotonatoxidans]